jgi:hypothetical protein
LEERLKRFGRFFETDPMNEREISKEKAKGVWLGADHFSAHYRTKLYLASSDLIC